MPVIPKRIPGIYYDNALGSGMLLTGTGKAGKTQYIAMRAIAADGGKCQKGGENAEYYYRQEINICSV